MMRFILVAGVALAALASPSWAEEPCGGTWLEPELFSALPKDKQDAELQRLADGLREGCAEAYNGLGYLASAVPGNYPDALKWFAVLVKVTETQRRQLAVQSALLDQFLKKIDEFSHELKAAEDKASAAAAEIAKAKKDQSTAVAERDGARADAKIAEEAVNKSQIELAALSEARMKLSDQLKQAQQALGKSTDAMAELRKNYDSVNTTLNIKLAELEVQQKLGAKQASEIDRLQKQVQALADAIAVLENSAKASADRIKKLEELVSSNAIEINDLKSALKTAEGKVTSLTAERNKAKAENAELSGKVKDLDAALKGATAEVMLLKDKLRVAIERANTIGAELDAERSRHKLTQSQLADALAKIEKLGGELRDASVKIKDMMAQIEALTARITFLDAEFDKAKAQIISLENMLKGANAKIAELSSKLGTAEAQVAALQKDVTSLTSELRTASATIKDLTKKAEDLTARNAVLESEIKAAQDRNTTLETENVELRDMIDKLGPYVSKFLMALEEKLGKADGIRVQGDRFVVPTEILFESGSSDLSRAGLERVEKIVMVMRELEPTIPTDIKWSLQISGHTDKQPVRPGSYVKDNWELSTRRALSVLRVMEDRGISPARLSAAGYAETRPIATGSTPQDLAQNRRIELKLTPD